MFTMVFTMKDQAKTTMRRITMLTALARGRDPVSVGERFGMSRAQVGKTLLQLADMGLAEVERVAPAPNAPPFIKGRLVYSVAPVAAKLLGELSDV